ncbi:hypothetical protein NDU88_009373 [Pleurodeles waltl]|uniref:Uncharacterized protein n=1 Tax=Pleurodeles waltl TaxID=8319 RepID=A0AAV7RYU9_PLEWA|nr:hypothetical protein NDU88_009373 [Pleurodeles waltl]
MSTPALLDIVFCEAVGTLVNQYFELNEAIASDGGWTGTPSRCSCVVFALKQLWSEADLALRADAAEAAILVAENPLHCWALDDPLILTKVRLAQGQMAYDKTLGKDGFSVDAEGDKAEYVLVLAWPLCPESERPWLKAKMSLTGNIF